MFCPPARLGPLDLQGMTNVVPQDAYFFFSALVSNLSNTPFTLLHDLEMVAEVKGEFVLSHFSHKFSCQ